EAINQKKPPNPYEIIAQEVDTDISLVHKIARGERTPIRGKGLVIKEVLERIAALSYLPNDSEVKLIVNQIKQAQ
ncbi:MAG: hypothetical protein ACK5L5_04190, partial [Bacteroidales bacterium]